MTEPVERFVPTGPKWDAARKVATQLENAGYRAYFVGGCLRDGLLGRPIRDIDIATDAKPEAVLSLFPKAVPTGVQHGTVTVIVDGQSFEVTTFRQETGYRQHRWPQVTFVDDLHADLSRRDFTVNAMALGLDGRWYDPFDGLADLRRGQLRAVGDPNQRFTEDALRMLRTVRFAAQLNFQIEPLTWAAIVEHASLLAAISMERIQQELHRIMLSDRPDVGMRLLQESGLKKFIEPLAVIADWSSEQFRWLRTVSVPASRWALLFLYPPPDREALPQTIQETEKRLRQLKYDRKLITTVKTLLRLYGALEERNSWQRLFLDEQDEDVYEAIRLYAAVHQWPENQLSAWLDAATRAAEKLVIRHPKQMAIDGYDLQKAVGRPPGPWTGRLLRQLFEEVAFGQLPNESSSLLNRAVALVRSDGSHGQGGGQM